MALDQRASRALQVWLELQRLALPGLRLRELLAWQALLVSEQVQLAQQRKALLVERKWSAREERLCPSPVSEVPATAMELAF